MKIKQSTWFPYCPALAKIRYSPHRPERGNAVATLTQQLESHSVVILSGRFKNGPDYIEDFKLNTQIGKSRLFISKEWKSYLASYGLSFYHHNNHHKFVIDISLDRIPDRDIYIFDEIHSFFPRNHNLVKRNDSMSFWKEVGKLIEAGKKIVFITTLHPQSKLFKIWSSADNPYINDGDDPVATKAFSHFFSAPVIELARER
ncbi:MAG: hypothetical protein HQ564_00890 [Candidatus Saganbacteria bacterium]|nr:hypothetical protein [Candidatus Saganbacteria bacterium]